METVKKTDEYTFFKKRSGRFGVKNAAGKWINGAEKAGLLSKEGLVKAAPVKKAEPVVEEAAPASEEAPAE